MTLFLLKTVNIREMKAMFK